MSLISHHTMSLIVDRFDITGLLKGNLSSSFRIWCWVHIHVPRGHWHPFKLILSHLQGWVLPALLPAWAIPQSLPARLRRFGEWVLYFLSWTSRLFGLLEPWLLSRLQMWWVGGIAICVNFGGIQLVWHLMELSKGETDQTPLDVKAANGKKFREGSSS